MCPHPLPLLMPRHLYHQREFVLSKTGLTPESFALKLAEIVATFRADIQAMLPHELSHYINQSHACMEVTNPTDETLALTWKVEIDV